MNNIDPAIIYTDLKAAAGAVCQRWCEEQGYSSHFLMGCKARSAKNNPPKLN